MEQWQEAAAITSWASVGDPDIKVDDAQVTGLPGEAWMNFAEIKNCTGASLARTKTLNITATASNTVQTTRAVSSGQSINVRLDYRTPDGIGGGTGITHSRDVTITDGRSTTTSRAIQQTEQVSINAEPMHLTRVEFVVVTKPYRIPFRGRLVVDGELQDNKDGKKRASDLLGADERTFQVEGYIEDADAFHSYTRTFSRKLTTQDCPEGGVYEVDPAIGSQARFAGPGWSRAKAAMSINGIAIASPGKSTAVQTGPPKTAIRGLPGAVCYVGPCALPLDGTKEYCYFDDDGGCFDCRSEFDPVCTPDPGERIFASRRPARP